MRDSTWIESQNIGLFLTSFFIYRGHISYPPNLERNIQKVQHKHHKNAANEHGYSTKQPKEQWEGEVESTKTKRPEVTTPVHGGSDVVRS